jgi:acetoin utilization deacetylase AcuC-like enzyme
MSQASLTSVLKAIPVYFSPAMQAKVESLSPSAHKPLAAVESWKALGIPISIIAPTPVTREEFARAHDRKHVDDILDCRALNGFYTKAADVAASLPYTSGAMLCAAREAIRNKHVGVAPTCGFHHAGYAKADAFCTFNGLMVAALALKAEGLAQRVGILDFDMHYGDGTENIIQTLGADFVRHYTSAEDYHAVSQAGEFLAKIPDLVGAMKDCDVVLHQTGADPHIDDPLGGWLTTAQLAERDRIVFETARKLSIPVAWNLAGGYQKPLRKVLDIHDNTMRACAAVYLRSAEMKDPKPETPPLSRAQRKIADAAMAAAKFKPTSDGKSAIRQFVVHGMAVTECVNVTNTIPATRPPEKPTGPILKSPTTHVKGAAPETPPLSRAARKIADATLAAAQFTPSSDGKNAMRSFEVHGMAVTEFISAEKAADAAKKQD